MEVNEYNSLASKIEEQLNQTGTLINFCVPGHLGYIEFRDSFHEDIPLDHLVIRADIVIAKRKFMFFYLLPCNTPFAMVDLPDFILYKFSEAIKAAILDPDKISGGQLVTS